MAKRRGNGEGTITERKDGRWQGSILLGYTADGKPRRPTVYGRTQGEVIEKVAELRRRHALGIAADERITVKEYLDLWREEKANTVKDRTLEIYELLSGHAVERIGKKRLDKVKPRDIQACIRDIAAKVGKPTANKVRRMLFGAFKQAVKWEMAYRNPVEAVDPIREDERPMRIWSTDQAVAFLNGAAGHRLFPAVYLMMATGLRRGEALGLDWRDLVDGRLRVQRTVGITRKKLTVSTPKTSRGARIVTVPEDALEVLAAHKRRQDAEKAHAADAWRPTDRVFTDQVGGHLTPMVLTHAWNRMQEAAGVPHVRLHDLRHLHVSLLVRKGLDPRTIADRIGHADASFTLRRYSHMFEEQRAAAAVNLTQLLRSSDGPAN